ncbi:MAG: acyl-CoA thioesterase [Candidatus Sericytochromatia bacterium]
MDNKVFDYNLTIKEFHLDTFGHVNNATYLQIYEEARWELVTQSGYGLDKIKETGLGPVILQINIKFIKEITVREKITIHTQLLDYDSKIGTIKQWITNEKDEICSDMEMKFALFDTKNRKMVLPTEEWLKAIGKG